MFIPYLPRILRSLLPVCVYAQAGRDEWALLKSFQQGLIPRRKVRDLLNLQH